jgi:hypothetical protein
MNTLDKVLFDMQLRRQNMMVAYQLQILKYAEAEDYKKRTLPLTVDDQRTIAVYIRRKHG